MDAPGKQAVFQGPFVDSVGLPAPLPRLRWGLSRNKAGAPARGGAAGPALRAQCAADPNTFATIRSRLNGATTGSRLWSPSWPCVPLLSRLVARSARFSLSARPNRSSATIAPNPPATRSLPASPTRS